MAQAPLTKDEINTIINCVDLALKSAARMQNSNKAPQIKEVYKQEEIRLKALQAKIMGQ